MRTEPFDVAMIGHFAKDRIVFEDTSRAASGGAVYYGSIALARLGYRVAVITRLHEEDFPLLDELRKAGIEVFAKEAVETSGMENIYFTKNRDKRVCKPLGFAGAFAEDEIPDVEAKTFLVIPILAGEVDLSLLRKLSKKARIALDAQGFVRFAEGEEVVFRDWPEKEEGLSLVDILKVDDTEAEVLTGVDDPRKAASILASYGPREIVLTHKGGVLVYVEGQFYEAPFRPREIHGRTGRGDTCFATYVAKRLSTDAKQASRYAAAVTSLKMEVPGPFNGTAKNVEALLQE
ncbi:carbohydrate kinase [Candidatus Bipolaricaulota bacterium]|nr:carbohydrate kinase [Candidatus Bipolaricaulota bacterium]